MVSRRALELPTTLFALVLCTGILSACADNSAAPQAFLTTSQSQQTYRLGVGDKLKVAVYGEQDLSGQLEVNALGTVQVPLIGEVPARGLSLPEFREQVQRRLADGYVKSPKVSVEILSYRPMFVHGEVKNGGEFAFKHGTRLRDAVAMAGGYTYRAEKSYVLLTRDGQQREMSVPMPSEFVLMPGDNIRVPERFF
jgi:polysaccharide export outer membrane protein